MTRHLRRIRAASPIFDPDGHAMTPVLDIYESSDAGRIQSMELDGDTVIVKFTRTARQAGGTVLIPWAQIAQASPGAPKAARKL